MPKKLSLGKLICVMVVLVMCAAVFLGSGAEKVSAATKGPAKVTGLSAKSAEYNAIKLTWKKAGSAKKYQVYRASSKNGKYKKVKTTKLLSYTNTSLTTGKSYYYKVRALAKSGAKGKFSSVKVAAPKLKTPSFKISAGAQTYAELNINKVNGASGYQVYRKTSGQGTFSDIGKYKSLNIKDSSLKCETGYEYKVRAYRKEGSKYVYSSFSGVKTVKTARHTCNWVVVTAGDGTVTGDKCSICGEERAHEHVWEPVYEEVDNGYYKTEKYRETWLRCNDCGADITNDYASHVLAHVAEIVRTEEVVDKNGCVWQTHYAADGTKIYGSYTSEPYKERQVWVQRIEKVTTGYRCSCGASK